MNRDNIVDVLVKHLKLNVPGLDDVSVDPNKSIEEVYGASSLDTVEIVSGAMRELDLRVPRKELSNVSTLGNLADLFLKFSQPATG